MSAVACEPSRLIELAPDRLRDLMAQEGMMTELILRALPLAASVRTRPGLVPHKRFTTGRLQHFFLHDLPDLGAAGPAPGYDRHGQGCHRQERADRTGP